jgi:probable DNA metabolism protein
MGFVRLQEMSNGLFYGFFRSDNDLLDLLAPEFLSRFPIQKFVLHDYPRKRIAYYDGQKILYADAPPVVNIELSDAETLFQTLWRDYHKNVSIVERKNPKLQRAFLPKKYRGFMSEFPPEE